ncbi:hypothetical protein ILUMI_13669 [Ignelater luminosus]|uniref:C2H2-type domain-containing protein n=1 Tax=Ignelater luminosus TaxID=2038154 RepID=A0A8K0CRY3_IGNLU|nr:hypothetical protein ILUMI_13669 [Ignelater luminosus]
MGDGEDVSNVLIICEAILVRSKGRHYSKYMQNEKGRFPCPKCTCSYKQKTHLIRHLNYECGVEPRFTCMHCGKKFKQKSNYQTHLRFLHSYPV